jgi:glycosyltransferase involved in cell wall biosynthesis
MVLFKTKMKSNTPPLHILFVCSGLDHVGGLERIVTNLANQLAVEQYKVSILIVNETTYSYYPLHKSIYTVLLNAKFGIDLKQNYIYRKFSFLKDIWDFKKVVSNLTPDIIISTDYIFTASIYISGIYKYYKCICWQHGIFDCPKSYMWNLISKRAYKKIQAIVAMNSTEYELYKKYNKNVFILPNFIEPSSAESNHRSKTILSIAALAHYKGIDLLLKAADIVLKKHTEWTWKLIGKGELESNVLKEIEQDNLQNRLILQAPQSHQITTEYVDTAIFVLTSRIELFGMVLIEAMCHGVPCIAFDCPSGPRHIITNTIDGFLVEPENPEALADAISILIENEEKRKEMGNNAFQNVKRFDRDVIIPKWIALFKQLTA